MVSSHDLFSQLMGTIQMLDHPLQTIFTDRVVVSGLVPKIIKDSIRILQENNVDAISNLSVPLSLINRLLRFQSIRDSYCRNKNNFIQDTERLLDYLLDIDPDRTQVPETVGGQISEIVKILLIGENEKDYLRMQKFTAERYQDMDDFLNDLSIAIKSSEVSCQIKYNLLSVFIFVVGDGNMAEKLKNNFSKSDAELLMETNNKDLKILMRMLSDKQMFYS